MSSYVERTLAAFERLERENAKLRNLEGSVMKSIDKLREWVFATDVSDVCHFWHGEPTKVAPDGFCAWGKRKEGK